MPSLRAGAARVCITPPVGVDLSGYLLRDQPSTGVHDDLYARALALDDGRTRLCLVACDLLGLGANSVAAVRRLASEWAGIDPAHVMVACTHTHGGPASVFLRHCGAVDPIYQEVLLRQVAGAVKMAWDNLQPARLSFGTSECHLAQCRRAERRPDGHPYDPEVGLLRLDREDGRPIATVMNYACHAVVMGYDNRLITADFPGAACGEVERATGAPCLFLQGACGDLNPRVRNSFAEVERAGRGLAGAALAAYYGANEVGEPRLAVASETLALPWRTIPRGEVEEALSRHREERDAPDTEPVARRIAAAFTDWAEETLDAAGRGAIPPHAVAEVQVMRLGDVHVAAVPGELFMALGRRIKEGLGAGRTLVAGYANGEIGYLFTREAAEVGGYEVDCAYRYYAHYPVAADAGERVVDAALRLGRRLS